MRVRMKEGCRPISLDGCNVVPAHPAYFEVPEDCRAGAELLIGEVLERAPYNEARNADGTLAPADPAQRPPAGFRHPNTRRGRPCKPLSETPGGTAASMTERVNGRFQRKAGV